jgi:hypothetical protein
MFPRLTSIRSQQWLTNFQEDDVSTAILKKKKKINQLMYVETLDTFFLRFEGL